LVNEFIYHYHGKENIDKGYINNPLFREDFELVKEFDSGAVLFKRSKIK
jgi:hypothetical protein